MAGVDCQAVIRVIFEKPSDIDGGTSRRDMS
jgi:hypothetical protein